MARENNSPLPAILDETLHESVFIFKSVIHSLLFENYVSIGLEGGVCMFVMGSKWVLFTVTISPWK